MAKKTLVGLLKKGWNKFLDPEAETRIEDACRLVRAGLKKYREQYDFAGFVQKAELSDSDRREVQRRVYSHFAKLVWRDLLLSDKEKATLEWIADSLAIYQQDLESIHSEIGCWIYAQQLAEAVSDGVVTKEERAVLEQTANWMGISLRELTHTYFSDQGEDFLRGLFLTALEDDVLLKDEWLGFLASAMNLGFNHKEALTLVEPHARGFVGHMLADAKSDMRLDKHEEESLQWMLQNFVLDEQFIAYVDSEMWKLRELTLIADGVLPTVLDIVPVETRAGEIVHFAAPCVFSVFDT